MYNLGGGTPNDKCTERDGTTRIPRGTLPTGDVARQQYVDQGGSITAFGKFGYDPIRNRLDLIHRTVCTSKSAI